MANDLSAILPLLLAQGVQVLRKKAIMPQLVNTDYSEDAAEKGDTINVPIPATIGTADISPSHSPKQPTDIATSKVQITLDKWRGSNPFYLTDKQIKEIERGRHFIPHAIQGSVEALADYVNSQILAEYKGVYSWTGTAAAVPFASTTDAAVQARKLLNEQKCPSGDRRVVLDFAEGANALKLSAFSDAEKMGTNRVKLQGDIGMVFGMDFYEIHGIPTHTAGAGTVLIDNGAGYSIGDTALHVDGVTTALVVGDLITIGGVQHVITVAGALATADQDITIYPALTAAAADDDPVTLIATHKVNLAFHRNAFGFAARPLASEMVDLGGSRFETITDPVTGLSLRLEVTRQRKQTMWEFDILFGTKLVRPELATRIIGSP